MTAPDDPTNGSTTTPGVPAGGPSPSDPGPPPSSGSQTAPSRRRAADEKVRTSPSDEPEVASGGKTAGIWIALILGAIVLILLLIFVIQNNVTTQFEYFNAQFDLPLGVAMLLAAIAGALVMALVGSVRMIQMGWTIRRLKKQHEKIHRATR